MVWLLNRVVIIVANGEIADHEAIAHFVTRISNVVCGRQASKSVDMWERVNHATVTC